MPGNGGAGHQASHAAAPAPAPLHGSRAERIAQMLQRILNLGDAPGWASTQAAFPEARWDREQSQISELASNTMYNHAVVGAIDLAGADYHISIWGTDARVTSIGFSGPADAPAARARLDRALASLGIDRALIGCLNPSFGYYRLRAGERSIVLGYSRDRDSPGAVLADGYLVDLDDPMAGWEPGQLNRRCA